MQGFALKRPGSGLKSLVHAARGAPPRKMLRSCTECLLRGILCKKCTFLGLCWGGETRPRCNQLKNMFKNVFRAIPSMYRCKSASDLCFQHLLLKFGRISISSDKFQKNRSENFLPIFFIYFFADLVEETLSFRTHSDSSKNIENSLFYGVLKIFCHFWLGPKKAFLGHI